MCIKICTFAYCVGSGTRQKGSNGYRRKGAMDMTERSIYSLYERDKRGKLTIRALIDVLDKAVAENAPVIFMCRKAYWLYRSLRSCLRDWDKKYGSLVVLSNRFVIKESISTLDDQYHTVYVFDDTVNTGRSLYQIYEFIMRMNPNLEIKMVVACAPESKLELKNKLMMQEDDSALVERFFESLTICYYVGIDEIGWISSQEIFMYQQEMIPYVIELPFIRPAIEENREETTGNPYIISFQREIFRGLCAAGGTQWKYVDNSYLWPDRLDSVTGDEEIKCGFFQYYNPYVVKTLGDYAPELIVKCRYEEAGDNVQMIFTPFAVMDSISFEDAWAIFNCLYMNTNYLKQKKKVYRQLKEKEAVEENAVSMKQLGIAVFRANVFFFSLYVYSAFRTMVSKVTNCQLMLDQQFMGESFSEDFIKYTGKLSEWKPEEFLERIRNLKPVTKILRQNEFRNIEYEHIKNDIPGLLAQIRLEILRKKRQKADNIFTPIEEIEDYVFHKTSDKDFQTRKQMLLSVILQMTDQSVIGNSLRVEDNIIYRGYRYGENSDVVLPFRNSYIQFIVEVFYHNCEKICQYDSKKSRRLYFNLISYMFHELESWMEDHGYLNVFVSAEELEWGSLYYSDERTDMDTLIKNKRMLMQDNRDRLMERIFRKWIDEFSDSWGEDLKYIGIL